jgi:hypothetical protein
MVYFGFRILCSIGLFIISLGYLVLVFSDTSGVAILISITQWLSPQSNFKSFNSSLLGLNATIAVVFFLITIYLFYSHHLWK